VLWTERISKEVADLSDFTLTAQKAAMTLCDCALSQATRESFAVEARAEAV
jgi:hypothetical protein